MLARLIRNIAFALPLVSLIAPFSPAQAQPAAPAAEKAAPAAGHKAAKHKKTAEDEHKKIAQSALSIENPWARAMLPGAKVGAGYFEIKNNTDKPVRLASVRSTIAEKVEIHSMSMDGSVMKMRQMKDGVEIPPHSGLSFKPGSFHLMFINPKAPFKAGEVVPASFTFSDGRAINVPFAVRAPKAAKNPH